MFLPLSSNVNDSDMAIENYSKHILIFLEKNYKLDSLQPKTRAEVDVHGSLVKSAQRQKHSVSL